MSRIQDVLERAERDGSVLRMRPMSDAATAADPAIEAPIDVPPLALAPATQPAEPTLAPGRTIPVTRLDPILAAALEPGASAAEQYRALRTRVAGSDQAASVNVILVTSPGRAEGKSLTAASLALAMAQDVQRRICLVDADLRGTRIHTLFGLPPSPGLADVLTGRAVLTDALTELDDLGLTVLPAGSVSAHPAELLGTSAMRQTIETLRSQFDRVIVDAPAAVPLADVGILSPLVDRVVLVVRAGVTTRPAIQDALAAVGPAKLLGAVLNDSAQ